MVVTKTEKGLSPRNKLCSANVMANCLLNFDILWKKYGLITAQEEGQEVKNIKIQHLRTADVMDSSQ